MQKTKKSVAKRFKITAKGKILRRSPNKLHFLSCKTMSQKRRAKRDKSVSKGFAAIIRRALPGAF